MSSLIRTENDSAATFSATRTSAASVEIDRHSRPDVTELHTEYFGDTLRDKSKKTIRIGFLNINGLSTRQGTAKYDSLRESILASEIDILGLAETNRCWHKMQPEHTWREISKEWWRDSKSVVGYNLCDLDPRIYQPGGVITVAVESACHRIVESGVDPTKLGRWTWFTMRGKNDIKTTVITMYRCCKSLMGDNTTYSQQVRHFNKTNLSTCPRQQILEDVETFIRAQQTSGHQIILMADMNEKVTHPSIQQWANSLELKEIITEKHGDDTATYHRGSKPIDGIFVSISLNQVLGNGYLPFGYFMSDHRLLWVDFPEEVLLGFDLPSVLSPRARKLQCSDPRISNRWNQLYKHYLQEENLHHRVVSLEADMSSPLTTVQQKEYNDIMKVRREAMAHADKHCRKICAGGVPFSPTIKKQRLTIEFWEGVSTRIRGGNYSSTKLRRLGKKIQVTNPFDNTREEINKKVKDSYVQYYKLKKQAHKLRETFLESKAEALAKDSNQTKSSMIKQLQQLELA